MIAVAIPPQIYSFAIATLGAIMIVLPRFFVRLSDATEERRGYAPIEGHPGRSLALIRIVGVVLVLIGLGGLLR